MQDSQVQEIKNRIDIVKIIGERLDLKKAGRNYKTNCPFHGEKTASFMVSPELQIFKCFGCGESGDVYSFLEKYEGMDFSESLKYLAERTGVKLVSVNNRGSGERERLMEIHSEALKFYSYYLLKHPLGKKALDYLINVRELSLGIISEFQIGYSPENSLYLKQYLVDKKGFLPHDIEKAGIGIVRSGSIYDRFNGRVVFPIFDHRGNPIAFSGRVLPWDKRETGKYINSPETPLYHKSSVLYGLNLTRANIKKKKVAIVVEGELDLISTYAAGIKNVVAIKGSALTEEQVKLLSRFAPKFILALDSDFAGDAAARRGIAVAENSGIEVKVAKISKFKDPDEAARKDIESYKKDLINAQGAWDYLIDSVFVRFNSATGEGKAKISKETIPILASIEDSIVQSHYANVLSGKLNVPLDAVVQQISKFLKPTVEDTGTPYEREKQAEKSRYELLEERLMTLCFWGDPSVLLEEDIKELIKNILHKRILEVLEDALNKEKFDINKFGSILPKELFDGYSKLILSEANSLADRPDELKKELDLVKKELKILGIKEKLRFLTTQMAEYEKNGDKDRLLKAQNQFNEFAKNLASLDAASGGGVIFGEN